MLFWEVLFHEWIQFCGDGGFDMLTVGRVVPNDVLSSAVLVCIGGGGCT